MSKKRGRQGNKGTAEHEHGDWDTKGTGERTPLTVQHMYGHGGWAAVGGDAGVVPGVSPGGVGDQQPAGSRVLVRHQLDATATSCADLLHLHAVPCMGGWKLILD